MKIQGRRWAFLLSFAAVLWVASLPLGAQEPRADKPADPSKAPGAKPSFDPTRRVPDFFGQIGLTPNQRESIYAIRGKHQEKIVALEKQIAQARAEMLAECETKLTDTQKELLGTLRRAAAERKKAKSASAERPAPEKTSEKKGN